MPEEGYGGRPFAWRVDVVDSEEDDPIVYADSEKVAEQIASEHNEMTRLLGVEADLRALVSDWRGRAQSMLVSEYQRKQMYRWADELEDILPSKEGA